AARAILFAPIHRNPAVPGCALDGARCPACANRPGGEHREVKSPMSRTNPHTRATPTIDSSAGNGPTEAAEALLARWLRRRDVPCALFLDVDGSLLDSAATPDAVVVPTRLRAALHKLHDVLDGALALVSGRPIEDLDRLFHPLALPAAGAHGVEWRQRAGGEVRRETLQRFPATIREEMRALAAAGEGLLLEDKGGSVAL